MVRPTESEMRSALGEGTTMKLNKAIAIPAIALAAGISLAACGSVKAPAAPPAVTHTATAAPKPTTPAPTTSAPTTPAPTVTRTAAAAPAPAPVVVVPTPVYVAPAPAPAAPAGSAVGNCGGGVSAGPNTSCPFARNVADAYNGPGDDTEVVYSPVTGQSYTMYYTESGDFVSATGGNDASVTFVYQPGMG